MLTFTKLLHCIGLLVVITRAHKCSFEEQCKCYHLPKYIIVRCSHRGLKHIPNFPPSTISVDLSHNDINSIGDKHFIKNREIRILDLSFNYITTLRKESFYGLKTLSNLTLNNNNISVFKGDVFEYLHSLTYLNIKNTQIHLTSLRSLDMPTLTVLKADLRLDGGGSTLPEFCNNIKYLDVSGHTGICRVNTIKPTLFENLTAVEYLDISRCQINTIYQGSFRKMASLSTLDISSNMCLRFSGVANITKDLPYTSIKVAKANQVYKPFDLNTRILASLLSPLKRTNLTELYVESNRIQLVESGALRFLPPTIRKMGLSANEFSWGTYLLELSMLPVTFINASNLFESHTPYIQEEQCTNHQDDNQMESNDLYISGRTQRHFVKWLQGLNASSSFIYYLPKTLNTVVYRNCRLRYTIPSFSISENTIERLDGGNNLFYAWIGPITIFNHAKYLDLSYNFCSNVSDVFFKSVPNLEDLKIEGNLLGFVFPGDVKGNILQHLSKVKSINMAENRIPFLPELFFRRQQNLVHLNLASNMLEDIDFRLNHMTLLTYLDLSKNRLQQLSKTARNQLDQIAAHNPNITVDLSDNNLKCTCETRELIKWLSTTKVKFVKGQKYTCKLSNGETQPLKKPIRVYETLEKNCTSYIPLIMTVVAFCILFITVLSLGLAYRNRWKLRYMYYMIKLRFTKNPNEHIAVEKIYSYDAFISYEDGDRAFVHHILLKKLEHDAGMKLCIHKRDFLPGREIAENITSAIHDSRKVIVIMSPNYIKSYWCMFEFNMAKVESIYSRNKENILFLVFLHQVPTNELPLNVLELVQTQSYIEYPRDEFGNTVFWEKLKEVMS